MPAPSRSEPALEVWNVMSVDICGRLMSESNIITIALGYVLFPSLGKKALDS